MVMVSDCQCLALQKIPFLTGAYALLSLRTQSSAQQGHELRLDNWNLACSLEFIGFSHAWQAEELERQHHTLVGPTIPPAQLPPIQAAG